MRLAREGHVVTMFPEGTRRTKGLVKRFEARPHSGAARIALEAGVPLVPAAVKGTDKLLRLGRLSVVYGAPVELDDLRGSDPAEAAHEATERLMARIARARGVAMSVLLAVDGDSFAHRAYHGLPKTIRLNAIVGFTNMLTRLWEAERPASVLVGWDTLEVPTYRHEAYEPYQSGRVFEESLLEQLALMPALTQALGFAVGKGAGYEADDFLAAAAKAVAGRRARRDLRPRRVPARERSRDDPPAGEGRERDQPHRARPRCASATASSPSRCRT